MTRRKVAVQSIELAFDTSPLQTGIEQKKEKKEKKKTGHQVIIVTIQHLSPLNFVALASRRLMSYTSL